MNSIDYPQVNHYPQVIRSITYMIDKHADGHSLL